MNNHEEMRHCMKYNKTQVDLQPPMSCCLWQLGQKKLITSVALIGGMLLFYNVIYFLAIKKEDVA